MVLPARFSQGTPGWYDQTMPSYEEDPLTYEQRVAAWVAQQNGGQMFQPPGVDPVTGFNTAGNINPASEGEYWANYLNQRANSAAVAGPNSATGKMFQLAMTSRAGVQPDSTGMAYNAAQAGLGGPSPILNDAMLNFLESMGYGPTSPPAAEPGQAGGAPGKAPGQTSPSGPPNWDMRAAWQGKYGEQPGFRREGDIPVRLDNPPSTGMPISLPPDIVNDRAGMGGNPNTIAAFQEFLKRRQMMQPPIQPASMLQNAGY